MLLRPREVRTKSGTVRRLPYQWAIEGDIKGCFDNIDHAVCTREGCTARNPYRSPGAVEGVPTEHPSLDALRYEWVRA